MDDMPSRLSELCAELNASRARLAADLGRIAVRDRWGLALIAIGWLHLVVFLACQFLVWNRLLGGWPYLLLWTLEFIAVLAIFRRVAGKGWIRTTPMAGIVARIWGTFLILAFNAMSLNTLTGWSLVWFKPVWATLSSFGFATMGWLVTPWFLLVAVHMYFTGLLMALNNETGYLVYAVSWWAALQVIGLVLEWRRRSGISRLYVEGPRPTREVLTASGTESPGSIH